MRLRFKNNLIVLLRNSFLSYKMSNDEIIDPNCIIKAFETNSITIIKDINNKQNVNTIVNNGFNIIKKINKFGWKTEYILLNRGKITYNIIFPSYV